MSFTLRPESLTVLLSCANSGFCFVNLAGITKFKYERTKRILVEVVKGGHRANALFCRAKNSRTFQNYPGLFLENSMTFYGGFVEMLKKSERSNNKNTRRSRTCAVDLLVNVHTRNSNVTTQHWKRMKLCSVKERSVKDLKIGPF